MDKLRRSLSVHKLLNRPEIKNVVTKTKILIKNIEKTTIEKIKMSTSPPSNEPETPTTPRKRSYKRLGNKYQKNKEITIEESFIDEAIKSDWNIPVDECTDKTLVQFVEYKGEKVFYAGTLNEIIRHITHPLELEPNDLKVFLLTFKSFVTPGVLLNKILERFSLPDEGKGYLIKMRNLSLLVRWIKESFGDFNEEMIKDIHLVIESMSGALKEKLENTLNSKIAGISVVPQIQFNEFAPKSKIPNINKILNLSKIKKVEIARQISLFDYECFSNIQPIEYLNGAWNNPKLKHRSVNILKMIHRFNSLSKFISYSILNEPIMKDRTKMISKVIDIAWDLYKMKNFSSAVSVISGLDNTAVFRLKYSKEK